MHLKKDTQFSLDTSETVYLFRALFVPKNRLEEGSCPITECEQFCVTLTSDRPDLAEIAISKEVPEDLVNIRWFETPEILRLA
jgi:hypothetical protein